MWTAMSLQRLSRTLPLLVVLHQRQSQQSLVLLRLQALSILGYPAHRSFVLQAFLPLQLSRATLTTCLTSSPTLLLVSRFLQVLVSPHTTMLSLPTTAPRLMAQPLLLLSLFQTGHQQSLRTSRSSFLSSLTGSTRITTVAFIPRMAARFQARTQSCISSMILACHSVGLTSSARLALRP